MRLTLQKIADITGGVLFGTDQSVENILTDSRTLRCAEETVFVALKGLNYDGHSFLEELFRKGVSAFILSDDTSMGELKEKVSYVRVDDTLDALQKIAAYVRNQYHGVVVGVAGSNGKTVVKEWISDVFPKGKRLYRSPRSYNSQLGVALSLINLDLSSEVAVIEAGISEPGYMSRLERMIRPDVVIFTSIGDAHQENFSSLEEKIDEKVLLAQNSATTIYHSTHAMLARVIEARYENRELLDASMMTVPDFMDTASRENAETVAALFDFLGYPRPDFSLLRPVEMRMQVKQGQRGTMILDDTYSADVDSLSIALEYLNTLAYSRKKTLILSDIHESGLREDVLYQKVEKMVEEVGIDLFIGIGKTISRYMGDVSSKIRGCSSLFFPSSEDMVLHVDSIPLDNSFILIKGNRISHTEIISHSLEERTHTTILEVNLRAMERNINYFRSQIEPQTKLVGMVKADAYGAGGVEVSRVLQHKGFSYLAVAFADEGVHLRRNGISMPILVLNADEGSFDVMVENSLEPEIYSFTSLEAFAQEVKKRGLSNYPVHIKLDSGMHRLGFMESEIDSLTERIKSYGELLKISSVFTHMCVADMPEEDDFSCRQIELFTRMSERIQKSFDYRILRHAEASNAMLRFRTANFDMCRLGIGMYGYSFDRNEQLENISTLKTRIVQIHSLDNGDTVGYGRWGKITRPSRVATIPIGYADGLNRKLSRGAWSMLVNGKPAPTIGNICMDSCMIDISDIEGVKEGDEVIIFSSRKGNTPENMADILDTIVYEVLTNVSPRVKRVYSYE